MKSKTCDAIFYFGTSAELIKLWPLINDLQKRTQVSLLTTNQQPSEIAELISILNLPTPINLRAPSKGNLVTKQQVFPWMLSVFVKSISEGIRLKRISAKKKKRLLVFVHGDTMSCVLGAVVGRIIRCDVAHIEAGLRSHDWKNPFPEELDRVITARLARLHFAPDEVAVNNLSGVRGVVINTRGNTSRDSMRLVQSKNNVESNDDSFILVSLHRAELISNKEVLTQTVGELIESAITQKIVMVVDALTRQALQQHNLFDTLAESNIDIREKMPYPEFLKLVVTASCVVTDSGGLQEECGFLAIPCLVHRRATERFDGIGTTAKLSMWTPGEIRNFIDVENKSVNIGQKRQVSTVESPTAIITQALDDLGYIKG